MCFCHKKVLFLKDEIHTIPDIILKRLQISNKQMVLEANNKTSPCEILRKDIFLQN